MGLHDFARFDQSSIVNGTILIAKNINKFWKTNSYCQMDKLKTLNKDYILQQDGVMCNTEKTVRKLLQGKVEILSCLSSSFDFSQLEFCDTKKMLKIKANWNKICGTWVHFSPDFCKLFVMKQHIFWIVYDQKLLEIR